MQSSSRTDTAEWREFCLRTSADVRLLRRQQWPPLLEDILGKKEIAIDRYWGIHNRMVRLFGPMPFVVEIGGGFGYQALLGLNYGFAQKWAIADLPEANIFQRAYLADLGYSLEREWNVSPMPLVISNYALSECRADVIESYAEQISHAERGYITWNGWLTGEMTLMDFVALMPAGAQIINEYPRSHPANYCIVWGTAND